MKTQLKILFFSFLTIFAAQNIFAGAPSMPHPGAQGMPPGPMPSVGDIFGNLSQDEIIQQVQEAQKFFDSLSPEEMAEVEKMVSETLKTMSEQDIQDIQQIATMVEPHLDLPKQPEAKEAEAPAKKAEPKKEETKKDATDIDTKNIQQLITDINKQVSEIVQKAESSKELAEEISHKWTSKVTFDNMQKQILGLKEERLAKKLSKKDNKEDQDLVEALEKLHTDASKHNKAFKVEDTFGIPESRKIEQKQLAQLKDVLSVFDGHIDKVMPLTENFLRKHDPEALELAKESEARAKKALEHAKDAETRRGSPPAQPSEQVRGGGMSSPQYPHGGGKFGPGYGAYPDHHDFPAGKSPDMAKMDGAGQSGAPGSKSKADDKKDAATATPYQKITGIFEDHLKEFDTAHEGSFSSFLKGDIASYPQGQNTGNVKHKAVELAQELKQFKDSSSDILKNIDNIASESDLQKLLEDKNFKKIDARLKKYRSLQSSSRAALDKAKEELDRSSDPSVAEKKQKHHEFDQFLQSTIEAPLFDAENTITTIESKIKRKKRTLKTAKK